MIIWGDILFLIDLSMDLCVLYFIQRLLGVRISIRRWILSGILTAAYSVFVVAVPINYVMFMLLGLLTALTASSIVLPRKNRKLPYIFKTLMLFVFLEAVAGGVLSIVFRFLNGVYQEVNFHPKNEVQRRLYWIVLGMLFLLCGLFYRKMQTNHWEMEKEHTRTFLHIELNGHTCEIECFFDTGNRVTEAISGLPVIFLPIIKADDLCIDYDLLKSGRIMGSRVILFCTVDQKNSCWGIHPNEMTLRFLKNERIVEKTIDAYVAFAHNTADCAIVPSGLKGKY